MDKIWIKKMITIPQSPITDVSFKKWGIKKVKDTDGGGMYYYYLIPLPKSDYANNDMKPFLISSANDEAKEFGLSDGQFIVRLFEIGELPPLKTEEEVELLYYLLTKENLNSKL